MPLRSIRLRFLALILIATGVACSAHSGAGMLPSSQFAMRGGKATPTPVPTPKSTPIPHAACAIRGGLVAPLIGKLEVETAFGQLEESGGTRYAASGVDFTTTRLHHVRAAQSGKLRYYKSYEGYTNVAVVTLKSGVQSLYAPLYFKKLPKSRTIRAGELLGRTGTRTLHFEITDGSDPGTPANEQLNPCGNADGATGTISIVSSPDVNVAFTTFQLDGAPFPTSAPGSIVAMPVVATVAKVGPEHGWGFGTKQFGVNTGSFNIVLCGNVVFQTGEPRFSNVVGATGTVTLPHLVFFRDAGSASSNAHLTETLPPGYTRACPAAPPVSGTTFSLLMSVGQIAQGNWTTTDTTAETMTMSPANSAVASVSPSPGPVPILTSPPSYPPQPGKFYEITAVGVGTTVITNTISTTATAQPITVTVLPTPTVAPWPVPLPNVTTTPMPTPTASTTETPSPSPSP
jgi:hypothetical protein